MMVKYNFYYLYLERGLDEYKLRNYLFDFNKTYPIWF